jgi:hypothetical protein
MTDHEIPTNICRSCRLSGQKMGDGMTLAEGCGHAAYGTEGARPCYCDFCAMQRGVCTICGGSMSTDRPSRDAAKGEGGARFTASLIILSAVALLAVAVAIYLLST